MFITITNQYRLFSVKLICIIIEIGMGPKYPTRVLHKYSESSKTHKQRSLEHGILILSAKFGSSTTSSWPNRAIDQQVSDSADPESVLEILIVEHCLWPPTMLHTKFYQIPWSQWDLPRMSIFPIQNRKIPPNSAWYSTPETNFEKQKKSNLIFYPKNMHANF